MRVLHIIHTLSPASGGPAEFVRNMLEFAPAGVDNELLCLDEPDEPFLEGLPATVNALGRAPTTFAYHAKLFPWLRENRSRFDAAVVNGLWQFPGFAASTALAGHVPYVVFPHGMLDPYFKRENRIKYLKKLAYWLAIEHRVFRRASRILFTCETELTLARQTFPLGIPNPQVIPFGARRPPVSDAQAAAFAARFPELQGKRFLLFLGRIDAKKGCDLLVDAFARTCADNDLHLMMAGPDRDNWRAALEAAYLPEAIRSRVHWPGMLQGDLKWGTFRACDAFILPSHQENFGIAVAEALACGKPVLLSDKVNIFTEVLEARAGLVEPDTAAGAAALISRWLALPAEEKAAMQRNALACYDRYFDAERSAEALYEVLGSIHSSSKS